MVRGSIDYVGINHYYTRYAEGPRKFPLLSPGYENDRRVIVHGKSDSSDILFPYVLHDKARVDFYKGYVAAVKNAINNGAKVIGYFAWSLLDNWEWSRGYTTRFGIVYVVLNDQKRYPKLSAYWFLQPLKEKKEKP